MRWLGVVPDKKTPLVVCLGYFDGVHLGHLNLINTAKDIANKKGYKICVHTYDAPPQSLLEPDKKYTELTNLSQKGELLRLAGVDYIAFSRFDNNLMKKSGADFLDEELSANMSVKHIVAGFNHRFGHLGKTDVKELQKLCDERGIGLSIVPAVKTKSGAVISSTAIKKALSSGDVSLAQEMLGRAPEEHCLNNFKDFI
ncbi:MAG: FAD synthetase family protein [Eubacteriales bacterium]|nr:FAD synthetase family protein [Eubacteriales bacterium]